MYEEEEKGKWDLGVQGSPKAGFTSLRNQINGPDQIDPDQTGPKPTGLDRIGPNQTGLLSESNWTPSFTMNQTDSPLFGQLPNLPKMEISHIDWNNPCT